MHKALTSFIARIHRSPAARQAAARQAGKPAPDRNEDPSMRIGNFLPRLICGLLLLAGPAGTATAADATFVGKLALIADPEVAKELSLSDETKKKLMELIDKREQEAISLVAKLKSLPQAKQAEQSAPFAAESEKFGKALLDDNQ